MGLLDGILGGAVGATLTKVVGDAIEQHGGVAGILAQFQKQGLGATVQSWICTGANQPVTPEQVHQALGAEAVQKLATQTGLSPQDLLAHLAEHLPTAVDKLTPTGQVPPAA